MTNPTHIHGPDDHDRHYHMVRCYRCGSVATLTVDYFDLTNGYVVECTNPKCETRPPSPGLLRGVMIGLGVAMTGWCAIVLTLSRLIAAIWR